MRTKSKQPPPKKPQNHALLPVSKREGIKIWRRGDKHFAKKILPGGKYSKSFSQTKLELVSSVYATYKAIRILLKNLISNTELFGGLFSTLPPI